MCIRDSAEGLLQMGNGALQVILGFGLGGAGRFDVQLVVPAAVACGDIKMRPAPPKPKPRIT